MSLSLCVALLFIPACCGRAPFQRPDGATYIARQILQLRIPGHGQLADRRRPAARTLRSDLWRHTTPAFFGSCHRDSGSQEPRQIVGHHEGDKARAPSHWSARYCTRKLVRECPQDGSTDGNLTGSSGSVRCDTGVSRGRGVPKPPLKLHYPTHRMARELTPEVS